MENGILLTAKGREMLLIIYTKENKLPDQISLISLLQKARTILDGI